MTVTNIQLFRILKDRLGEREAEDLINYVKSEVKEAFDIRKDSFATKDDEVSF